MDIEAYFERIGYKNSKNKLDLETLTDILQHQIRAIPFENLNIHCGESMELDLEAIFDQVVRKKRGGWCLQVNRLLHWALTTMGFETTMLGAHFYISPVYKYSREMIHLLVLVTINNRHYIADAACGFSYQMWAPMELISGNNQPQVPATFHLTDENGTWFLDQVLREQYVPNKEFINSSLIPKEKYRKIYCFTLQPRTVEDFVYVNTYLQTSPTTLFTTTSFCCLQTLEGIHCLVGSTLTCKRFNYKENIDLMEFKNLNEEEIEQVLKTVFGISLEKKFVPKHGNLSLTI